MADKIKTGTIFIKQGALLPKSLRFESKPYSSGWREVNNLDGGGLDRKIRDAGWTFFYMAGEITASVFGFDGDQSEFKAVKRVMAKLKLDKCNSLEITRVTPRHFLGLPYVTVSAHARHIQQSISLFQEQPRLAEPAGAELAAA
jgi:hypothetical protein